MAMASISSPSSSSSSSSSEWAFSSFNSCRKQLRSIPFIRTFNFLPTLSISSSNSNTGHHGLLLHATSSSSPPALLPLAEVDGSLDSADAQQYPFPESGDLNDFLCRLFETPQLQQLAYQYYKKAKDRPDFEPGKSTLDHIVRFLVQARDWGSISALFDDFKVSGVLPNSAACCGLIDSCIEARKFKLVENLLQVLKSYDDEVALLAAFHAAMRGYNRIHMFNSTILLHEKMKSAEIDLDPGCYFRVMEAYSRTGNLDIVVELLEEFQSKKLGKTKTPFSTQIYGLVCESLSKSGRAHEAIENLREMKDKGIYVHHSIYSSLVSSLASTRQMTAAEELLEEAKNENRVLRDPEMYLKLVLMYAEEGLLEKTLDVVEAMKAAKLKVSDCIFCAIINSFSKKRGYRAAATIYEELVSRGYEAGQVTYASTINAYCRLGLHPKAEEIFVEMEKKGFDKCVVAYSSMISMYGKTGRPQEAMRLLGKMKAKGCRPNVWIYNSLMDMHGRAKNLRQVEKLRKEMERRKVSPDKVTYTILISAYNKAREFETCMGLYHEYRKSGGGIDRAMGGIMVGVFSKSGRVDELLKLLQDMRSEGTGLDGRLLRSALNALRDAGLPSQAEWLQKSFET